MLQVYKGHLVYYDGSWIKTDEGTALVKSEASHTGKTFEFENIVAKSTEQLAFLLSTEIQKATKSRNPVFIDKSHISYEITSEFPEYSERLQEIGG